MNKNLAEVICNTMRRYEDLPMKEKIDIIAPTFGAQTGTIGRTLCTGKFRGHSDLFIDFDNSTQLWIGTQPTPASKTKKVQNALVTGKLRLYAPEIVAATKEAALEALQDIMKADNAEAEMRGIAPYEVVSVELVQKGNEYIGWYYVVLKVNGKLIPHMETGTYYDIMDGTLAEQPRPKYRTAALVKKVEFIFGGIGFDSASCVYRGKD